MFLRQRLSVALELPSTDIGSHDPRCGAVLSAVGRLQQLAVDRCMAQTRRASPTAPPVQPVWPLRLMRIQMAVMYLTSGLFKLIGPGWRSGSTVYYATTQNIYGRVLHVYPLPQGIDWILTALSYATVLWEITFPLMMLHRVTRTAAILIGVGMHLGIGATMEVGPFSLMMLVCYSAFISPEQARRVVGWLSQRRLASGTRADTPAPAAEPTSAA